MHWIGFQLRIFTLRIPFAEDVNTVDVVVSIASSYALFVFALSHTVMASSGDFVLRSLLDIQDRRHEQTSVHPERLDVPQSDAGELEPVLLEG